MCLLLLQARQFNRNSKYEVNINPNQNMFAVNFIVEANPMNHHVIVIFELDLSRACINFPMFQATTTHERMQRCITLKFRIIFIEFRNVCYYTTESDTLLWHSCGLLIVKAIRMNFPNQQKQQPN